MDTCAILKIEPTVSNMSDSNSFSILFDHPMHQVGITTDDIEVLVESKYRTISFDWEAEYTDEQTLSILIFPISALDGTENVTVNLFEYKTVRGEYGG